MRRRESSSTRNSGSIPTRKPPGFALAKAAAIDGGQGGGGLIAGANDNGLWARLGSPATQEFLR